MRLQGAVLLPTLLLAVVLFAWFARNAMTARRLLPLVATLSISLVAGLALVATGVVDRPLGAYTGAATTSYDPGAVLRWIGLHAGDVALLVVGVPIVGTLILAVDALARERERDPAVQALLAVTLAYTSATVVVVGTFASTYVQQLAERNLITAAPAIFVAFAVWLDRGVPRPQPSSLIVALAVVVPVGLLPVSGVASEAAFPDAFITAPLIVLERHLSDLSVALLWAAATIGVTLLAVLVPRRGAALLPSVVLACLIAASALATEEMENARNSIDTTSSARRRRGGSTVPSASRSPTFTMGTRSGTLCGTRLSGTSTSPPSLRCAAQYPGYRRLRRGSTSGPAGESCARTGHR